MCANFTAVLLTKQGVRLYLNSALTKLLDNITGFPLGFSCCATKLPDNVTRLHSDLTAVLTMLHSDLTAVLTTLHSDLTAVLTTLQLRFNCCSNYVIRQHNRVSCSM